MSKVTVAVSFGRSGRGPFPGSGNPGGHQQRRKHAYHRVRTYIECDRIASTFQLYVASRFNHFNNSNLLYQNNLYQTVNSK